MRILISLLLLALLTGCATLRPPYDPQVTVAVRELYFRMKSVAEDGDAKRLSLADSRRFLRQSWVKAQTVRQRVIETKTTVQELALLDSLDQEYQSLLRHPKPLRNPAAVKLMADLQAWQDLRPLPDTRVFSVASYDTPDIDTSNDSTNSKNCRDNHDQGGRDCGCKSDHR